MTSKHFVIRADMPQVLNNCVRFLQALPRDKNWSINIEEQSQKRSVVQNNRYWAILGHISDQVADENGRKYSSDTWHEYFKAKFIGKDTIIMDGNPELVPKSSAKLKVMQFAEYMTQVEAWGVDHNVHYWDDAKHGAAG